MTAQERPEHAAAAEAGAAMDALIEQHIFNRRPCHAWRQGNLGSAGGPVMQLSSGACKHAWNGCYPAERPTRYSTDYGAAMRAFEAMVEMTGAGSLTADMEDARGEGFVVSVTFGFDGAGAIGPFPLVVCQAALAAFQAAVPPADDDGGER